MSKQDKDTVLENFIQAYTDANGKAPSIDESNGWYSVNGDKNVRLAQLEEMTDELSSPSTKKSTTSDTKTDSEAKKKTAITKKPSKAKSTDKNKSTKKKKSTAAKKSSKKKKPATTFSVKDFYTQQILDANSGAIEPR